MASTGNGGIGTLFQLTPSGTFSTIYDFCSQADCVDGISPSGGLIQGPDGSLYGTTQQGGALPDWGDDTPDSGFGTVFTLDASGVLTTLYSFCASSSEPYACVDGEFPTGPLVEGLDKNFYGMSNSGGEYGYGTVFKITPAGQLTTLYSFCTNAISFGFCTDGENPMAGLALGKDGNFYGTTFQTGYNYYGVTDFQGGTVFRITPAGELTTLHTFCTLENCQDGSGPTSTLISALDGNLYGTTSLGGYYDPSFGSYGTVFRVTTSGAFTTVYTFCENTSTYLCAADPAEGLYQSSDGTLYGTAGYADYYAGSSAAYAITGLTGSLQATTLTSATAPKPLSVGQTVTLSATVASSGGTPAGNVTFSSGTEVLCTAALSSGKASCSLPTGSVGPGTYPLVAQYYGSVTYNSATATGSITLSKAPTSVVLAVNPDTITPPTTAELVVTVARSAAGATGTPTGNVSFYSGQTLLGKVTLSNGFAVMAVSVPAGLAPGTYPVIAKYGGDSTDLAATSNTVDVTVQAAK
jgi:uncharacterized repeat protein (TIGR03803 family)